MTPKQTPALPRVLHERSELAAIIPVSPPGGTLFLERAVKEAVHELGHTYGLGHCRDPRCIMYFSNTLHDTDLKGPGFCAACGEKVNRGIPG